MTMHMLRILAAAAGLAVAAGSAAAAPAFIYLQCSDDTGATMITDPGMFSGDVNAAETKTAFAAKLEPFAEDNAVGCTSASLQVMGPFATEADAKKDRVKVIKDHADAVSFQPFGNRVVLVPYPN